MQRLAGRAVRAAAIAGAAGLEPRTRDELARCVADVAAVHAALATLQWTRNKAALAL